MNLASRAIAILAAALSTAFVVVLWQTLVATPSSAATATVSTSGFDFSPSTVTIAAGDTVTWTNLGGHTVTANDSSFDSGQGQSTFSRTFSAPGTYDYFCANHGGPTFGMRGRVVVLEAGATATATATTTPSPTSTATPSAPASQCGTNTLMATLTGSSQVPAVSTAGGGSVRLVLDPLTGRITGTWGVGALSAGITGAHIHQGAAGTNGPVVVDFTPATPSNGGSYVTVTTVAPSLVAAILANPSSFYVNVHTSTNPSGEIRGQLACAPAGVTRQLSATLTGSNQVPPVAGSGAGTVTFTLDASAGKVSGAWTIGGLSGTVTGAHIHRGAPATNGPVVIDFTSAVPSVGGSFTTTTTGVSSSLIESILGDPGGYYVNVHTARNPGGEIRGQLGPTAACPTNLLVAAPMLGRNEVPPNFLNGAGTVMLTLDPTAGTVAGTWSVDGLSSGIAAAHIHVGGPDVAGPVVIPFGGLPSSGGSFVTWTPGVDTDLLNTILAAPSAYYVNVHTSNIAAGEVRAQLGCASVGQRRTYLPVSARDGGIDSGNVAIYRGTFFPSPFTSSIGSTVQWSDQGGMHTVTSEALKPDGTPLFDSGTLAPGQTFSYTFGSAGTYPYYCTIHGKDQHAGTIVVQ